MTKTNMAGTTDHDLASLVGKKIKGIVLQEVDVNGDGENVRQFYIFTCTDGEKFVLAVDGGNTQQYARAELLEVDEFADFLEGIECEDVLDDSEDESSNEDDDDSEDDDYDNDHLFDDNDDDF